MLPRSHLGCACGMEEAPDDMEAMDRGAAMKMLASVQMAREHCAAGRHGAATALFMQVSCPPPGRVSVVMFRWISVTGGKLAIV